MRVALKSITEFPLNIKDRIEAAKWELESEYARFIDSIDLVYTLSKAGREVLVQGCLKGRIEIICSRCLEKDLKNVDQSFVFSYDIKETREFIDLDSGVKEEIFLNWPIRPLCRPGCRGICPGCGRNLNLEHCICGNNV